MIKKHTIEDCRRVARERGGKCLSDEYVNCNDKMIWKCKEGHIWNIKFRHILDGRWCRECSDNNKRNSIEKIKGFIEDRGGKLLTENYQNTQQRLLVQCEYGHDPWEVAFLNLMKGKWCPTCSGNRRCTIKQAQELAKKKNGQCLSVAYANNSDSMIWQCEYGHKWKTSYSKIKAGRWCPICNGYVGENICRLYFNTIFDKPFIKTRPKWLLGEKGYVLELDGFCSELSIAFEHNGLSHFIIDGGFNKTEEQLKAVQLNDYIKQKLCKENNIKLIVVPQIFIKLELEDLKNYIYQECIRQNIDISLYNWNTEININSLYSNIDIEKTNKINKKMKEKYLCQNVQI